MQQTYIGTKAIKAEPMTRRAYNELRGWPLPADENGADDGYLVEYLDGGKPNVAGRDGYVSWSPKEQFNRAYRRTSGLPFGLAAEAMKMGMAIARAGWNGRDQFVYMVGANSYAAQTAVAKAYFGSDAKVPYNAYMAIKGTDGTVSTWAPSGSDALAEDWVVVHIGLSKSMPADTAQFPDLSSSQVDPSMALPSRTTAEWAASGCLTPEYMTEQAAKNASASAALAQRMEAKHLLAPHQQRVVDELTELLNKANNLNQFFSSGTFNGIPLDEKARLRRQLVAMYAYSDILAERIAAFQ